MQWLIVPVDGATDLCVEERVDGRPTREDDEGEAGRDGEDKAKLDGLAEDGGSEVHEDVTRDVLVTEGDVAEVAHLSRREVRVSYLIAQHLVLGVAQRVLSVISWKNTIFSGKHTLNIKQL